MFEREAFSQEITQTDAERRGQGQKRERRSGLVVAVNGSRATVAARMADVISEGDHFWSVGELVSIYGKRSRVVGLVQEMVAQDRIWDPSLNNYVHANIEILGEVTDVAGRPVFRRGVSSYPSLGSAVDCIRQADLAAIYDLGDRKASVIGTLVQADIPAAVDIDAMLRRHFAIVGTTGVGKSTSIGILLRTAIKERPNMRVVILDPHNEYSTVFQDEAATIEASCFELPFWLFQFEEFLEVVYRGAPAAQDETEFLREAVSEARERFSSQDRSSLVKWHGRSEEGGAETPRPYRLVDIFTRIEAEIGRLEPRYSRVALRNLKHRLEAISNDQNFRFMFGKAAVDGRMDFVTRSLFRLQDVARPVTILRMAGIPSDVVNASVSVLTRLAFDLCVQHRGRQEMLVVCEEAHRYVPAELSLGFVPTRRSIARIAKEGRKYGCYLGIVTQRPAELDPTILSQCSTIFAMRLSNAADQQIMRSAIPDNAAGALEFISALNNREAIAFGEAAATAMRMVFATQDEAHLPRMTLEPGELVAGITEIAAESLEPVDEPQGQPVWSREKAVSTPAAIVASAEPRNNPFERFQEPISAPSFGGWSTAKRTEGFAARERLLNDRLKR
ncbi:MAG: ATP-binding protein [Rhodoblastus sp.]